MTGYRHTLEDVNIAGATMHVQRFTANEDRPTIIFLHDSLGCVKLWRDFPVRLGQVTRCNVLVYDRQGYGASAPFSGEPRDNGYLEAEADVLAQLIRYYALKEVILFGHSDGGSIALIAGAKYPECIRGIITEGAHIFVEEITLQGIREAVTAYKTTNLREKLKKYHGEKTAAVFHAWADTWLTEGFKSWNIEHFLPGINCPSLIIQGEADEYGSLEQVEGIIQQTAGHAQKLIIPGIGHTPHREAMEVVLESSLHFINRLKSANRGR